MAFENNYKTKINSLHKLLASVWNIFKKRTEKIRKSSQVIIFKNSSNNSIFIGQDKASGEVLNKSISSSVINHIRDHKDNKTFAGSKNDMTNRQKLKAHSEESVSKRA